MNGDIYKEIKLQYEGAKTAKERQDCTWTMLCMIGTNHVKIVGFIAKVL